MKTIYFDAQRTSASHLVERVWSSHSDHGGHFLSVADSRWEIVFEMHGPRPRMCVRGPDRCSMRTLCPPGGEWLGIRLKPGVCMPALLHTGGHTSATLLASGSTPTVMIRGHRVEIPSFDTVELFVERLRTIGVLDVDWRLHDALYGWNRYGTDRTMQRHFRRDVGFSRSHAAHIEQARSAIGRLVDRTPIAEAALESGYYDQAHMTRAFRSLISATPSQIRALYATGQLSFLYQTPGTTRHTDGNGDEAHSPHGHVFWAETD